MGMDQYIDTIFSGMNIHLPAILGFTRYQGFDPSPYGLVCFNMVFIGFKMVLICLNGEHEFPTHPGFFWVQILGSMPGRCMRHVNL